MYSNEGCDIIHRKGDNPFLHLLESHPPPLRLPSNPPPLHGIYHPGKWNKTLHDDYIIYINHIKMLNKGCLIC